MPPEPPVRPTIPVPPPPPRPPAPDGDTFPPEADEFIGGLGLGSLSTVITDTEFVLDQADKIPHVPGYELLAELGRGGMGVVYKARDPELNRTVAVKMIRPDARPGPGDLVRFQAEAEAVAAVKHPNVVEVHVSGRVGDRPYFVMEYVEGGTLAGRLAAGRLAPAAAAAVVAATARGVDAAHAAGVVHRDLKPGNVLLKSGESGGGSGERPPDPRAGRNSPRPTPHPPRLRPKVADFGLAKRLVGADAITKSVAFMGTPAYMAPEQARGGGKFVGPAADVYALGVILFECLTGRLPFAHDDPLALLRLIAEAPPPSPRSVVPAVPRDLELVCLKCLAKNPADRYATAGELADDLDRFGAGVPVTARPVPPLVRLARCVARNPAPAALAAVVVAVVAAAPAAWFWHSWRTDSLEARALRDAIARGAAERRAADRELVALQATIGQRATERRPGWTWANRAELARAAALAADNPAALAALRAEAAAALFAPDLRKADPIAAGFSAGTAARSADGTRVALGMQNVTGGGVLGSWASLKVLVVDPDTGAKYADVSFPAGTVVRDGRRAPDRVVSLAYGPDGRWLFAGTRSARVVRIDTTADPPAVKVWNAPAQPDPLVVSADGAAVVGCCGTKIVRWDARTGAKTGEFEGPPGGGLAALPDGGLVAAFPEGLARAGGRGGKLDFPPPKAAGGYVRHPVAFPGGKLIAAARGGTIELWDADALATVGKFTDPDLLNRAAHAADVTGLAVHPSGAYLASAAADRSVKVWAVGSGLRVGGFQLPGTGPAALAWSAGGRFLLATGVGDTARFEFAAPAAERYAAPHPHPVAAAAVDPAGGVVALAEFEPGANARTLFRTDPAGLPAGALAVPDAARPALAVHPADGRVVATREAGLQWWHPDGSTAGPRFSDLPCRCPAFSADGGTLWAIADSKTVRAWDAATGAPRGGPWVNDAGETVLGQGSLEALAVGKVLAAAGGRDGAVRLFGPDVAMLKDFQSGNDPVAAVAVAPDDEFVAAGAQSGKLRLVRVADRTELAGVPDAHAGGVTAVSFAAGGTLLASGGNDRAVRFWRVGADGSAEPLAAVTGLPAPVRGVSFARSGERLVVQLLGGRAVRVWDVGVLRAQLSGLGLGW